MDYIEFWTLCSSNNIILDQEQIELFKRYHNELKYWNEKVNMVSRKDTDNILERHILHSLSLVKYVNFPQKAKVLDIGTGGGLPGLPVKIALPAIRITMVDSIKKKAKMTKMFADHTGLNNINVFGDRVEELNNEPVFHHKFDFIIARAVARTEKLITWSRAYLKKSGKFCFLKGGDLSEEIKEAKEKYRNLKVKEIDIDFIGFDWFKKEEKKLITCSFE